MDVSCNYLSGFDLTPDNSGCVSYENTAMADITYGISRNKSLAYLDLSGNW